MILSELEIDSIFDEYRPLLVGDDNITSIEVDDGNSDGQPRVIIYALDVRTISFQEFYELAREYGTVRIPVEVLPGVVLTADVGRSEDRERALAYALPITYSGMGGTQLVHANGSWGTLTIALKGMEISIEYGVATPQICKSTVPTLISNAHVLQPVGTNVDFSNVRIGTTTCHLDMNRYKTIDYGHARWDNAVVNQNFWRIYDPGDPAGRKVGGVGKVSQGIGIAKQGAKTGWTTGNALVRAEIQLNGYSGTFPCWRGSYGADSGDSGSAILNYNGSSWIWVGVHFASNSHFWSWDTIGRSGRAELLLTV
jgi:hypothetical protein